MDSDHKNIPFADVQPITLSPIGVVESPYAEKFGVPRQPNLVRAAQGAVRMLAPYDQQVAFDGIEGFSHLWLTFGFHQCEGHWRTRVRPPRLGGNQDMGVFATRSPFRPNNLGLSVVRFLGLEGGEGALKLRVSGLDLVDGTPVYDIKPYVPYADALPEATAGFAVSAPPRRLQVRFAEKARQVLHSLADSAAKQTLIEQTLALDPRPAYRQGGDDGRQYGMRLKELEVRWQVSGDVATVTELLPIR